MTNTQKLFSLKYFIIILITAFLTDINLYLSMYEYNNQIIFFNLKYENICRNKN